MLSPVVVHGKPQASRNVDDGKVADVHAQKPKPGTTLATIFRVASALTQLSVVINASTFLYTTIRIWLTVITILLGYFWCLHYQLDHLFRSLRRHSLFLRWIRHRKMKYSG